MIRLAVVDDHALVIEGLSSLLRQDEGEEQEFVLVASGATSDEVLAQNEVVDVVLLDLMMERPEGQSITTDVERWCQHGAAVVVHTSQAQPALIRQALAAGASGLVLKTDPLDRILSVVSEVHSGQTSFSGELAHAIATDPQLMTAFSSREIDVLRLISAGSTHRMVAKQLGIGEGAVREYLNRAVSKLRNKGMDPGNAHGVVSQARAEGHLP